MCAIHLTSCRVQSPARPRSKMAIPSRSAAYAVDGRSSTHAKGTITTANDLQWMYEIGVCHVPPMINLLDTPASRLLGTRRHKRFMRFMRTRFNLLSNINRISSVSVFAMWAAPRSIGRIVTPIMAMGMFPVAIGTVLMMSCDLLKRLLREHEFWFFTLINACNWIIAAVLFDDSRIVGCISSFVITQLVILMDANFRTIISATRSTILWVPAILVIISVSATRVVDIDSAQFLRIIPHNKIGYTLANSFLNNNFTLVVFIMRKSYRRRQILQPSFLEDKIIPCSVLRCGLVLRRMKANDADARSRYETFQSMREQSGGVDDEFELNVGGNAGQIAPARTGSGRDAPVFGPVSSSRSSRRRSTRIVDLAGLNHRSSGVLQPHLVSKVLADTGLAWQSHQTRLNAHDANRLKEQAQQRLRVVTPTLAFLDLRNHLIPRLAPTRVLPPWLCAFHYSSGIAGVVLSGMTMYLPAACVSETRPDSIVYSPKFIIVPIASFVCSTAFFVPFVASCQRDIVRALFRNFDFMFSSIQFLLGGVCLADMLQWDYRSIALLSWFQWFHWVLLWDAVVPAMRERLHFKKVYGTPVLIAIMAGLAWIVYSLFFSAIDALVDRTIVTVEWGELNVSIRTSTFLIGRVNTLLTWSIRLLWKAVFSEENELVLIRGMLEYHTPMEIFPVDTSHVASILHEPVQDGPECTDVVHASSASSGVALFSTALPRTDTAVLRSGDIAAMPITEEPT